MKGRILIVDDCEINIDILRELLQDEYDLDTATSGEECLQKVRDFAPDLVLLDIMMPGLDGYETCRRIKESPVGEFTQVLLISGRATAGERLQGYEAGADDYIVKPFHHEELLARIRILFRLRRSLAELWVANARVRQFNEELEQLVKERTGELVATRDLAIFALAKLAESRDPETSSHLERIREYSCLLANQLRRVGPYTAQINEQFVADLYRSSPLHDIGKVGIPDAILLKPARLSPAEFEIMKRHTIIGAEALEEAARQSPCGKFLQMPIEIARSHHERFNGRGYPDGLAGEAIPLSARIVALADVYDALTTARVYKEAYDPLVAKEMILAEKGQHFDPAIVEAFEAIADDFVRVREEIEAIELATCG